MIAIDVELLSFVVGGGENDGGEGTPPPNRTLTEGHMRVQTPLYDTGWDTGTTTTARTRYTKCLELMPDDMSPAQIREACGTPNRPR